MSLGTCFGKFTKSGKFHLKVTCLDYLAQHAKVRHAHVVDRLASLVRPRSGISAFFVLTAMPTLPAMPCLPTLSVLPTLPAVPSLSLCSTRCG